MTRDELMVLKAQAAALQRYLIVFSNVLRHEIFSKLSAEPVCVFIGNHLAERMIERGMRREDFTLALCWAVEKHTPQFLKDGDVAIRTAYGTIIVECSLRTDVRQIRFATMLDPSMEPRTRGIVNIRPVDLVGFVPLNQR